MAEERQKLIAKAKLAEQAERYDDMSSNMKKVVEQSGDEKLSTEVGTEFSFMYLKSFGLFLLPFLFISESQAVDARGIACVAFRRGFL